MAESGDMLPAIPPKKLDEFAPSFDVIGPDKKKFTVAADYDSNRAFSQIVISRIRSIYLKELDKIEIGVVRVDSQGLKRMVEIGLAIEDGARAAYGDRKKSPSEEAMQAFGSMAIGAVRAASQGAMNTPDYNARLDKIRALRTPRIKKAKPAPEGSSDAPIDIQPEPPAQ